MLMLGLIRNKYFLFSLGPPLRSFARVHSKSEEYERETREEQTAEAKKDKAQNHVEERRNSLAAEQNKLQDLLAQRDQRAQLLQRWRQKLEEKEAKLREVKEQHDVLKNNRDVRAVQCSAVQAVPLRR
jgi:chromosome segregation ATPase